MCLSFGNIIPMNHPPGLIFNQYRDQVSLNQLTWECGLSEVDAVEVWDLKFYNSWLVHMDISQNWFNFKNSCFQQTYWFTYWKRFDFNIWIAYHRFVFIKRHYSKLSLHSIRFFLSLTWFFHENFLRVCVLFTLF